MHSGKVVVFLLIAAACLGAWLGPAGERVDPDVGPSEAFFKSVLTTLKAPQVYLAVAGKDPSPALLVRFRGVEPISRRQGNGTVVDLERLDWVSEDAVICTGSVDRRPLQAEFRLDPSGKWKPAR